MCGSSARKSMLYIEHNKFGNHRKISSARNEDCDCDFSAAAQGSESAAESGIEKSRRARKCEDSRPNVRAGSSHAPKALNPILLRAACSACLISLSQRYLHRMPSWLPSRTDMSLQASQRQRARQLNKADVTCGWDLLHCQMPNEFSPSHTQVIVQDQATAFYLLQLST